MNGKMKSCVKGILMDICGKPLPLTAQKEPVAYLYNGVRLPKLPEWDRETYPYAVIARSVDGGIIFLSLSTSEWYRTINAGRPEYLSTDTDGEGIIFVITAATNGEWVSCPDFLYSFDDVEYITLWSNSSIVAEDEESIYLAASDPVPVYGGGAEWQ